MCISALNYYRITKYNPIYRPEEGGYSNDEWISISDIGLYFNGVQFTASEYFEMENKYWETIKYLLELCNIQTLKICGLEKYRDVPRFFTNNKYFDISPIEDGNLNKKIISMPEIEMILRLCLRGEIWCRLEHCTGSGVYFGYDYYMYFRANTEHTIDYTKIPGGIFIETDGFEFPYPFITGDEETEPPPFVCPYTNMTDMINLFRSIKDRPSMFMFPVKYDSAAALIAGYDIATDGNLLEGFHEWLNLKLGFRCEFCWDRLLIEFPKTFGLPEGFRGQEPTEEHEKLAITALCNELEEFYLVKKDRWAKGLRWIYAQYDALYKKFDKEQETK